MANQLRQQIEQISREKNINPDVIIAAIEDAILTASKKYYKGAEDLRSRFNDETGPDRGLRGEADRRDGRDPRDPDRASRRRSSSFPGAEIELGQEIEFPKPTDVLGRIAAQTAKQVIFQKVREAERDNVFAEYSGRVGEVVNGIVKRQEMGDFVVDLGPGRGAAAPQGAEPGRDLPDRRPRAGGDRARGQGGQGPAGDGQPHRPRPAHQAVRDGGARDLRRHRPDPGLRARGGRAGQGGGRSRASATSTRSAPASGMKGTRVQSIIRELRGEKIDIVEWSDDPTAFVVNALSPAKVSRVSVVDEEQRIMEVVVEDKQLSLAIGKKGQNVRLAAKLVGWRIDIKSEEEKRREVEAEMARMARIVDEITQPRAPRRRREDGPEAHRRRRRRARPPARDDRRRARRHRGRSGRRPRREDPRGRGRWPSVEWDERDAADEAERGGRRAGRRPSRRPRTQAAAEQAAADAAAAEQAAAGSRRADGVPGADAPGRRRARRRAGEEGGTDGER